MFRSSRSRSTLVLLFSVFLLSWFASACGDDDKKSNDTPSPTPDMAEDDMGGEDTDVPDLEDEEDNDEPDLPEGPKGAILGIEESGRWTFPELQGEVHVVTTELGVPHIYASNAHDLYFVEGFVMARDRYLEFELGRRLGAGKIASLLGQDALEIDQLSRGLGRGVISQRVYDQMTEDQRALFEAYAQGINKYIQAAIDGDLPAPSEIALVGGLIGGGPAELMKPVTGRDVVDFLSVIVHQLGFEMDDLDRAAVFASLEDRFGEEPLEILRREGVVRDVLDRYGPMKQVSSAAGWGIEGGDQKPSVGRSSDVSSRKALPRRKSVERGVLDRLRQSKGRHDQLMRRGPLGSFGSNGWAVGASGTTDGSSILAGDGHLPLGVPSIFYQVGLDTSVFGEGDIHQLGLVFTGFPFMTVGTNGHVAWTQTYLYADVTDWYAEEIQLGEDGLPSASLFQGEWRPLSKVEESYEIANVPALGSVGRTETWARWTTFDGRPITSVEGRVLGPEEEPAEDDVVISLLGQKVIPGDMDGDGVVSAISFDYTGFDIGNVVGAVDGFHKSEDLAQWRDKTRGLVAYAQSVTATDKHGSITNTGYNGMPCRSYLPRDEEGRWLPGADPRLLLDGTTYRGFEIPLDENALVDESHNEEDPYRCVIPFEEFPQALNPERGFVLNANNDPGNITTDGSIFDDPWYMGYAWAAGYRADSIYNRLESLSQNKAADIDSMAELQADSVSPLGRDFGPLLLAELSAVKGFASLENPEPWQVRALEIYEADAEAMDEVVERLEAWIERGTPARSGVDTFYQAPSAEDRGDAVATMLFNAWFRAMMHGIFADEGMEDVWVGNESARRMRIFNAVLQGRGEGNPEELASWNEVTGESVFFDVKGTEEIERSQEIAVMALRDALLSLRAPVAEGGFGTDEMDMWLWGMKHMVRFPSILAGFVADNPAVNLIAGSLEISTRVLPLADGLDAMDPRRRLKWFPRDGDWFGVDAANPGWTGDDYTYENGPVMRMVIRLKDGEVEGQNILPGGQSAITTSPHFADQAALWLENKTVPMRFYPEDVAEGAEGREVFAPAE